MHEPVEPQIRDRAMARDDEPFGGPQVTDVGLVDGTTGEVVSARTGGL